jgi:hypothetical protein
MQENGDDAGASKVLAASAEAQPQNWGERAEVAPPRASSGNRLAILVALPLILATLLVIARPYFLRRNLKRAGDGWQATIPLRGAFELYGRRHDATQRRIDRAENELGTPESSPVKVGPQSPAAVSESPDWPAIFKRTGEFWSLAYRGKSFQLKDVKGLAYIAFLLAHPGERFHVRELIARLEGPADTGSGIVAEVSREVSTAYELGDAGDALDSHALADYRRRFRELAEELAEAERHNDIGRTERIRGEQEFLNGELSAAVGIGGRTRKVAADVERARDVVGKNIRSGLRKIRNEDVTLGRYFDSSIKTGYYCAYLPDPERSISWQL